MIWRHLEETKTVEWNLRLLRSNIKMEKLTDKIKLIWEKGLVHIFAGSFLTKCIAFFGSIVLVRALSKFDYGVLTYLENIYGYIWIVAGMGMSNAILRFVVLKETIEEKRNYFLYAIRVGFQFNVFLILCGYVFNTFYPHKYEYKQYAWLLYILLMSLPFQYLTDSVLGHERAMFANKRYVALSVVLSLCVISFKAIFGNIFGVKGAVFAQTGTYIALGIIFVLSTWKQYYNGMPFISESKIENRHEVNLYSFQYMVTNGLWAVFMLNDTFLLGRYCAAEVLADYRVAYTIPGCVTLISSSIGIFIAPYFVKNENDTMWIRKNYINAFGGTALFVGIVCLCIAVLARPIVLLLYGKQYISVIPIMRVLLIAAFCNCGLRYPTANLLAAMGQIRYNMIVSAVGTILQILINIWAIPKFGAYGVAATSCFIYFFMAVTLLLVFYQKYYTE